MRATRSTLKPGEHTIEDANITRPASSPYHVLQWFGRLPDGSPAFGPKKARGKSPAEARAKAHKQWEAMLETKSFTARWKPEDSISSYMEAVTVPLIAGTQTRPTKLARSTVERYLLATAQLQKSLGDMPISNASTFSPLESALLEIASKNGSESARQARGVLSKYVILPLLRDGLIDRHPLAGIPIDLGDTKKRLKPAGGQALPAKQYRKVLSYLLTVIPEDGVSKPRRGRYVREDLVAKRRASLDLTLFQMTTGLRISEARTMLWENTSVDKDGRLWVTVSSATSKTKKGREVPVLDLEASQHLLKRKELGGTYIIGAPTDPNSEWDRANCWRATKPIYKELADRCDAPLLAEVGSHVWRATLNGLTKGSVDQATRSAFFGHTEKINERYYTDGVDVTGLISALATD